jgi:hypothetical protein
MNKFTKVIVIWITKYWFPNLCQATALLDITRFIEQIQLWIKSNGLLATIRRLKTLRLVVTRYICDSPLSAVKESISIDHSGFPKCIRYLRKYLKTNEGKSFVLTLMVISRSFHCEAPVDYSSVTDEFKGTSTTLPKEDIIKILEDFKLPKWERSPWTINNCNLTGKAGPAGHALSSALYYIDKFSDTLLASLGCLASDKLIIYFTETSGLLPAKVRDAMFHKKYDSIRRLSIVKDPEAKMRVIAIVDYWTQLALKPLHKWLFEQLRTKFPQDRTFTQDPHLEPRSGHKFHSLDLHAATDRLPMDLQTQVLDQICKSANSALAWRNLMVNEPFLTPEGNKISYTVGQPMGAKSSWAMLALTHHVIVQYSAMKVGQYPFNGYILLGDDIVINHDDVAAKYRETMDYLGVEISDSKTHVSSDTYEFAKRWFHQGIEITGIPVRGILENLRQPTLLVTFIFDLIRKGCGPRVLGIPAPSLLEHLYDQLGWSRRRISSNINQVRVFYTLLRSTLYKVPDQEWRQHLGAALAAKPELSELPIPIESRMLEKLISTAASGALNHRVAKVTTKLLKMSTLWLEEVDKLFPRVNGNTHDSRWALYNRMPIFHAIYTEIQQVNKKDRLFKDIHEFMGAVEAVVVPNMETAFSTRKSSEVALATASIARDLFKDPMPEVVMGGRQKIAGSYVTALSDIAMIVKSPEDRKMLELQRAIAGMF